ncbi:MAG: multicopper oxidase domain-containing protein, partial [Rhodothermales bacterium]|nr:multicopper oxidase domain-containing protein [Rhodothermales bacterium]
MADTVFPTALHRLTIVLLVLTYVGASTATGQGHDGHMMHPPDPGGDVWRMPPMDPAMPMLPGLEDDLPPVGPFMPGRGVDVSTIPHARPGEVVDMADGDTLEIVVSLVRRHIAGHDMLMYGYNGQYPGPLIKARQGSTVYVDVENRIELPTTVHWHGVRLDNAFDGVPGVTQDPIEYGDRFLYEIKVR